MPAADEQRDRPVTPLAPAHQARRRSTPPWKTGIATNDAIVAVASNETVFALAAEVPDVPKHEGGRPNDYPTWVYVMFGALIGWFGSASATARELGNTHTWALLTDTVARVHGPDKVAGLSAHGPTRHHWAYAAKTIIRPYLGAVEQAFLRDAVTQAVEQGCFKPGPLVLKNARRGDFAVGDGKVFSPRYRACEQFEVDTATGEVLREHRVDPASAMHTEISTDERRARPVFGTKHVSVTVRADNTPNTRVALTRCWQPKAGGGGEPGHAMRLLTAVHQEVARQGGQMHGAVWDGALSGVHHNEGLTQGWVPVSPTKARINPGGRSWQTKGRIAKDANLGEVTYPSCTHLLHAVDGRVNEAEETDTGTKHFTPLWFRVKRRPRKDTTVWYAEVRIPCEHGEHTLDGQKFHSHHVHLTQQPEDDLAKFNRAENLRAVPRDTPEYEHIYGWRADAESKNNQDEHAFHLYRMPAIGEHQQRLILMGLDLLQNSISRAITRGTLQRRPRARNTTPIAA